MTAESKVSALDITTSYVSFEIMPTDRPVLGLTRKSTLGITKKPFQRAQTIVIQIFDDMRKVLLRLFVEVGHSNTSREDSIIGMLCRQICSCLGGEVLCNFISQNAK
jgi:hypothetical protein